jgi:acyl-CoA thioesterase FadM
VDDLVDAHVRVVKVGHTSLVMETALYQHETDELICRVQNTYVNVDQATNQPTPVEDSIRAAIARMEAATPP